MIIEAKTSYTCDPNVERYEVNDDVEMLLHPDWISPMFVRTDEATVCIPEASDMRRIREAYPWLEAHRRPDALAQCIDAYNFLTMCRKQSSLNAEVPALRIRNHAEDVANINISESSFFHAALLAGFSVEYGEDYGNRQMNIVTDADYVDLLDGMKRARRTVKRQFRDGRLERLAKLAHQDDHLSRYGDSVLSRYDREIS